MSYRRRCDLKVYRLENRAGKGPYRAKEDYSKVWREGYHDRSTGRPTPLEDKLHPLMEKLSSRLKRNQVLLFGFATKAQLYKWFSKKELQRLKKLGFGIREYRPKISYSTRHQAVFVGTGKR